jgi:hypothetical protein
MSEGLAGIAAIVLPPLIAWVILASSRLKSVLAMWYASLGEQREWPEYILFELTCANCLVLFIFADIFRTSGPREFWELVFVFVLFWPFWLFVGSYVPNNTAVSSAWKNYRQTWFKVCAGYCLCMLSLAVFVIVAKTTHL